MSRPCPTIPPVTGSSGLPTTVPDCCFLRGNRAVANRMPATFFRMPCSMFGSAERGACPSLRWCSRRSVAGRSISRGETSAACCGDRRLARRFRGGELVSSPPPRTCFSRGRTAPNPARIRGGCAPQNLGRTHFRADCKHAGHQPVHGGVALPVWPPRSSGCAGQG